ncbi:MAG: acyloxyacyl hydrolase [Planctomycetota bacterium]
MRAPALGLVVVLWLLGCPLVGWAYGGAAAQEDAGDAVGVPDLEGLSASAGRSEAEYLERGGLWGAVVLNTTASTEDVDVFGGFQVTTFLADRFEVGGEVGPFGSVQDGADDAIGLSASLVLRYHAVVRDRWTGFVDGGFGVLWTSQPVPAAGTRFNFLPRVGVGVSRSIGGNARVLGGVRWHHVSNARITGDDGNPARDELALFLGVQFAL